MKTPIFERFSSGLTAGIILCLILAHLVDQEVSDVYRENVVQIFAIVAALIAAILSLMGVQRQIRVQMESEDARRAADLAASRAVLPLLLSRLYAISIDCFEVALMPETEVRNADLRQTHLAKCALEQRNIEILQDCIRFSDRGSAEWLSLIARKYQVFHSRYESYVTGPHMLNDPTRSGMALDCVELRAIFEHCFDFARGSQSEIPERLDPSQVRLPISSRHFGTEIFAYTEVGLDRWRARHREGTMNQYDLR